jgi:hypothetical protein
LSHVLYRPIWCRSHEGILLLYGFLKNLLIYAKGAKLLP